MPIICLMVRENPKLVREMSGKSQGILWGLLAGHPDWSANHLEIFLVALWIPIIDLSISINLCDSTCLIIRNYGQHSYMEEDHNGFWKSMMNYGSPQMIMGPLSNVRRSILMRFSRRRTFIHRKLPHVSSVFTFLKKFSLLAFHKICQQSAHLGPLSDVPNIISHTAHGHHIWLRI